MTDLARLVVALEAQTAKYQAGLDDANKRLSKFHREQTDTLKNIEYGFSRTIEGIRSSLELIGIGLSFKEIIDATSEAEHAMALLDNAIKQTGGSAGFTTAQLADYSDELSKVSTFSNGAIKGAEQLLLRFQSIQGTNFTDATKSTLDLASALGIDLQSAAELVGKALEDPIKGMTNLARSGVVLGESQKQLITHLVETGQQAKAQHVLLQELEKRYGGAAEAARDTFGGALAGLKNQFENLLEGKGGMEDATKSINELTDTLSSPEVKAGFETLISGFAKVVEWAAKAASAIAGFSKGVGEFFGELAAGKAGLSSDQLKGRIAEYEDIQHRIRDGYAEMDSAAQATANQMLKENDATIAGLKKQLAVLQDFAGIAEAVDKNTKGVAVPKPGAFTPIITTTGGGAKGKIKDPELADVVVGGEKVGRDALRDLYAQWDKDTQTEFQKQLDDWTDFITKIEELQRIPIEQGGITEQDALDRIREYNERTIKEVEVAGKKMGDNMKKVAGEWDEYWKQASHNTVDIISSTLEDGFKGGIDGILKAFGEMLKQLVEQAVAADIGKHLFGDSPGGGGGWIGEGLSFVGSLFGGAKDSGGSGMPGRSYYIGTGAQPEMFTPTVPGHFTPATDMGGKTEINFAISAPGGRIPMETQQQIAARTMQALQMAQRRNG